MRAPGVIPPTDGRAGGGRGFRRLIGALSILAVGQVAFGLLRAAPSDRAAERADVIGRSLTFEIRNPANGAMLAVDEVDAGFCRYIAIYSPTCAPSRSSAAAWLRVSAKATPTVPEDWRVFWVSLETLSEGDLPGQASFAWPAYEASDRRAASTAAALPGTPSHIVLDREGKIVEVGLGATLWKTDHYRTDCTIEQEQQ